eukprot:8204298-Heterocapsa_arctica.AAC.1
MKIVLEMCAIDLSEIYSPESFKNKALRMILGVGMSFYVAQSWWNVKDQADPKCVGGARYGNLEDA